MHLYHHSFHQYLGTGHTFVQHINTVALSFVQTTKGVLRRQKPTALTSLFFLFCLPVWIQINVIQYHKLRGSTLPQFYILLLETPCPLVGPLVRNVFYPHLTCTHTNLMCECRLEDDNDNNNEEEEEEDNDNNDDKEE